MGDARVSQSSVEALIQADDVPARVTQSSVEALILPDSIPVRVSQSVVEALVQSGDFWIGGMSAANRTGTEDPYTWAHDPQAQDPVAAIIVAGIHSISATDHISGITYGGEAMTRIVTATDTATEPGRADLWVLLASIPAGVQTISVDLASATTDDFLFAALTVFGTNVVEVIDSDSISENATNPSVSLTHASRMAIDVVAIFSGQNAPANLTEQSGMGRIAATDFGNGSAVVGWRGRSTDDVTIGYTAGSDDVALVAFSIAEVEAAETEADAEVATGTGAAYGATPHVIPNAALAAGTGQAYDATGSTAVNVSAELATGVGSALSVAPLVAPNAGLVAGSGAALDATVSTESDTSAIAELATGAGAAHGSSAAIAVRAETSSGSGDALDATASVSGDVSVNAGLAAGTGTAQTAHALVYLLASFVPAEGSGVAYGAVINAVTAGRPRAYVVLV